MQRSNTMQPSAPTVRHPVKDEVERWDDDGDFDNFDEIHLRTASTATSSTSFSAAYPHHRDSISSRMSMRSDLESNQGDEDWQVLLPDDDPASTRDAIAVAKSKGIPIPADVPKSALEGGTIRRLGGKKIKKALGDDWSEDLEMPGNGAELKLAKNRGDEFPDTLRQISAAFHKTPEGSPSQLTAENRTSPKSKAAPASLDQFRENQDDDDFENMPTIKIAKSRGPNKSIATGLQPAQKDNENLEDGLELPKDGKLHLPSRKEPPRTPQQPDDLDIEWAEGSLGTRNGGTKRDLMSNRSSSVSAMSPSVSSCLTAESEDEGLDCLLLPSGPFKFEEALKKRQQENQSPDPSTYSGDDHAAKRSVAKEDFSADLEIGDGDVFDSGKLTLNRNIKHNTQRSSSPQRRTATTLTFTNAKSQAASTRIPRLHGARDRPHSTLEPVSETGPAAARFRRPESWLSGQLPQSSVPAVSPSLPSAPSTPSRRGVRSQDSRDLLRAEPGNTITTQLLRSKRSMPVMRGLHSPTKPSPFARPPSRSEMGGMGSRLGLASRPKTPTDRSELRLADAGRLAPFLPAGVSIAQSQHGSMKGTGSRQVRRHDSGDSNEGATMAPRPFSRLTHRPETPGRAPTGRNVAPPELTLAAKKTMTKPARRRNFGDGTELEIFDDLPTSATIENKFVKQPIGRGAPKALRSKLGQSHFAPSSSSLASGTDSPMPITPVSPIKQTYPQITPRFARDTAASRNAREQRNVSASINAALRETPNLNREGGPLAPLSTNWKAHVMGRSNANGLASPAHRKKHSSKKEPQKPQLIKGIGNGINEAKSVKGMHYNPVLFRWEGNENALAPFDGPTSSLGGGSPVRGRDGGVEHSPKHSTVGQPALIANVGQVATGVQVVGGMVFDPKKMCWLKMAPSQGRVAEGGSQGGGSGTNLRGGAAVGSVYLEEEEDVFAGLEDLKEEDELTMGSLRSGGTGVGVDAGGGEERKGCDGDGRDGHGSGDESWLVSEEFDVGPDFIRRQRNEEERWKRRVSKWLRPEAVVEDRGRGSWRWAIREVVSNLQVAP